MQSVLKAIKFQWIGSFAFRSLIFILLLILLAVKLGDASFSGIEKIGAIALAILPVSLLVAFLNQWCEFRKWKEISKPLGVSEGELVNSFFDGLTSGFLSPNGWGTFVGRLGYIDAEKKASLVYGTVLANVAQLIPTLLFGGISLLFIPKLPAYTGWITAGLAVLLILGLLFADLLLLLLKHRKSGKKTAFRSSLAISKEQLLKWSFLRYLTFGAQYLLLFFLFGYTDIAGILVNVAALFVLTSVVPSLWSGKILIRETAAVFLFSHTAFAIGDVVLICLLVWCFNVVSPVIFGSFRNMVALRLKPQHGLD